MKTVIILIGLIPNLCWSIDCNEKPIVCQIMKNGQTVGGKYTIKKEKAEQLAKIIKKVSKKHNIPANLFAAILAQESLYNVAAKNCQKGFVTPYRAPAGVSTISSDIEVRVCSDFGISQIHYKTVELYKFDINRLLSDVEYSVEAGAIVLSWFIKTYKHEEDAFTRYNCGLKGNTDRKTCQEYKKLVERFM